MQIESFLSDIPLSVGIDAHRGSSFVPERRGEQERWGYAEGMANDYAALAVYADTDEKRALLDEEFTRYREGYRARTLAHLRSQSRCMSTMITGGSNFPVRRNQKRLDVAHNRLTDLLGFRERALEAIKKKLRPELRPIMSGDADATDRLQAKITQAEEVQARMKVANKLVRQFVKSSTRESVTFKHENGCVACTLALQAEGFTEQQARRLLTPDFAGRVGFPSYELTNNNANIRRMKERLESVSKAKEEEETEIEGENARIEDSPADNRVRLFFPGKPSADVRTKLKSSGFRWTPSLGCWQAYRNYRTLNTAKEVAGVAA